MVAYDLILGLSGPALRPQNSGPALCYSAERLCLNCPCSAHPGAECLCSNCCATVLSACVVSAAHTQVQQHLARPDSESVPCRELVKLQDLVQVRL